MLHGMDGEQADLCVRREDSNRDAAKGQMCIRTEHTFRLGAFQRPEPGLEIDNPVPAGKHHPAGLVAERSAVAQFLQDPSRARKLLG
jgi:hypothetical protein